MRIGIAIFSGAGLFFVSANSLKSKDNQEAIINRNSREEYTIRGKRWERNRFVGSNVSHESLTALPSSQTLVQ